MQFVLQLKLSENNKDWDAIETYGNNDIIWHAVPIY